MDKEFVKTFDQLVLHIQNKNGDEAKKIIEADIKLLDYVDLSGRMAIHWAASSGCLSFIEFVLQTNEALVSKTDASEWTPLMIAASAGHLDVVKCLLSSHYTNVNHRLLLLFLKNLILDFDKK